MTPECLRHHREEGAVKRWVIVMASVMCQTALGGIYAWSAFVPPLTTRYGLSSARCSLLFGAMIATFTITTIPAGRLLLRYGPRRIASAGAILFAIGYLIASYSEGSFVRLLLGLGLVAGSGIGLAYVCPLSVGMAWFPRHRGLVTGVAVAGFGMGAILLSALAERMLVHQDVLVVLRQVGLILGALALCGALVLSLPPTGMSPHAHQGDGSSPRLRSLRFTLICLGMFAGTFAGLLIAGHLVPLAQDLGRSPAQATMGIWLFAIGNTCGRLGWGEIHDLFGARRTILCSLASLALPLVLLLLFPQPDLIPVLTIAIGLGFGACFVVYAAAVADIFGPEALPRLYPICFTGYGLAALAGPTIGGWIKDTQGSYLPAIALCATVVLVAMAVITASFRRHSWHERRTVESG